jgi:hypothetical protein
MARTTSTPHKVSRNKSGTPIVRALKLFSGRPTRTTRETAFETEQQAQIFADALMDFRNGGRTVCEGTVVAKLEVILFGR